MDINTVLLIIIIVVYTVEKTYNIITQIKSSSCNCCGGKVDITKESKMPDGTASDANNLVSILTAKGVAATTV